MSVMSETLATAAPEHWAHVQASLGSLAPGLVKCGPQTDQQHRALIKVHTQVPPRPVESEAPNDSSAQSWRNTAQTLAMHLSPP